MLSSHLSRPVQVPVRPTHIFDRRAATTVLAVQSVPIEKDEVRAGRSIDHFVDAKKVLDRSTSAAFRAGVERSHANHPNRLAQTGLASPNRPSAPRRPSTARLDGFSRLGPLPRSVPPLLDFRHAAADNEQQM